MSDSQPQEERHSTTNTNPTWVLGLMAFSVVSFVLGLFILPQKVEMVRFVEFSAERDDVWQHIDQIEDWDTWDAWGHQHKKNGERLKMLTML